ncbi:head completion protein [Candidatus Dojkabacteria bacterium]|nr:head completion protein [Candidatus Dojkabacteria bacterium]
MSKPHKGKYIPTHSSKYNGNVDSIIYRSSWERRVMVYLDNHPQIVWWSSEELFIPYKSPIDNKVHKYFIDFVFRVKGKDNKEYTHAWEVKPFKQTLPPVQRKKTKLYLQECATYAVNQEKWRAAELFCLEHGWKFSLITEKQLGI